MDIFNKITRSVTYDKVTDKSDLSIYSLESKIELFKDFDKAINCKESKEKKEHRLIVKAMLDTIQSLNSKLKKFEDQRETEDNQRNKFESFADCVNNKKKENVLIIKKMKEDDLDMKKEFLSKLDRIKKDVLVERIKVNKHNMIVNVRDEHQQNLIVNELKDNVNIKCEKPKKKIPMIMIKEIERIDDKDAEEIKCYLKREIALNNDLEESNVIIKAVINKSTFRTMRCVISLKEDDTKKVIRNGFVKIGYMACPIEKTVSIAQCNRCQGFGHFAKSLDGKVVTCKSKEIRCGICADNHDTSNCSNKGDKNRQKCANCRGNHTSFSNNCIKKKEVKQSILSKCVC